MDNKKYKIKEKFVCNKKFINNFSGNLAILCSDERFNKDTLDFLYKKLRVKRQDLIVIPGSIAFYTLKEENNISKLDLLITKHNIKNLYVFAHTNCGFYKSTYPNLTEEKIFNKQIEDLASFKNSIVKKYSNLNVKTYYVGLKNNKICISEVDGL